ncbi:hypothetical protein BH11PLA2_BH11PLA2_02240 [soil metagenome]
MLAVHVRINDGVTKQPTAVRLRITGPGGEYYAPLGRLAAFSIGRGEAVGGNLRLNKENWAYIDGSCEVPLPAGVPLRIQATKGPEYTPLDETVTLGAGKLSLRFEINRWSNLAAEGWTSVDSHVHFLDPHTAMLEAAAEDVDVTNVLAHSHIFLSQDGNTYAANPNLDAFSGQSPSLDRDGRSVLVNTLNTHPVLGRLGLLNSHRPVYPLAFGGALGNDDWSLFDWCRQCRRKKGLTVWVDAFKPEMGLPGGEALVAAILGEIDAIEFDAKPRKDALLPWVYRLWNAGFPIPLIGGSGKDSNTVTLGAMRTYAKTDTETSWVEAVRAGRSFITTGPLIDWSVMVDDHGTVTTTAVARSHTPFERLEIVADGQVIAVATAVDRVARIDLQQSFKATGWIAARVIGTEGTFAHTSPRVVEMPGVPLPSRRMFLPLLRQSVEQTREWAIERGQYCDEKWRRQLVENCDSALNKLTIKQ